jgi:hypothetical protein
MKHKKILVAVGCVCVCVSVSFVSVRISHKVGRILK